MLYCFIFQPQRQALGKSGDKENHTSNSSVIYQLHSRLKVTAGWRNKSIGSSISSSSGCGSYLSSSVSHLLTCGCSSHLFTAGWNFHWRTKYCSMSRLFNYRKGKQKKEKVTAGSSISHICWRLAAAHICWRPAEISIGEQNKSSMSRLFNYRKGKQKKE